MSIERDTDAYWKVNRFGGKTEAVWLERSKAP